MVGPKLLWCPKVTVDTNEHSKQAVSRYIYPMDKLAAPINSGDF